MRMHASNLVGEHAMHRFPLTPLAPMCCHDLTKDRGCILKVHSAPFLSIVLGSVSATANRTWKAIATLEFTDLGG